METTKQNLNPDSEKSDSVKTGKSDKDDKSKLENMCLKEYFEICKRYPTHKRHRKGIKPELEKLARKYPGISFPGSHLIKLETTEYEIRLRQLSEKLRLIIKEKLNKDFRTLTTVKYVVKVLERINQAEMIPGSELLKSTGIGHTSRGRIIKILISLGFIKSYWSGKYHRYVILEEGRKFLEMKG